MTITNCNTIVTDHTSSELLCNPLVMAEAEVDTVAGAVDHKNQNAIRSKTGRWRSAAFIVGVASILCNGMSLALISLCLKPIMLGVEMAERIAFYGIQGNLINFLTGELGQTTATAAANVNAWTGVASLLPVLGAVVADSFLGKYYTVISASVIYILGLGLLTVSAMLPSLNCLTHGRSIKSTPGCSSHLQTRIFFGALYLVALGQGGHKPCVQAFGADQFDGEDPVESKAKSSFFNWWYFGLCLGAQLGTGVVSYVQDNLSWGLGFGIPCIFMVIALLIFILGTFSYRFIKKRDGQGPFLRIGRVFVTAARNRHGLCFALENEEHERSRLLDKTLLAPDVVPTQSEIEEGNALLRLFPIWATSLIFGIVFAQLSTFFTKQGFTMDRSIGSTFNISAASLQSFSGICIIVFVSLYDLLLVPLARRFTGQQVGITVLQRIGTGLFISIVCMVVAAVVESKRLKIAFQHGLIDLPKVTVPMSIRWLLPQYALFGVAEGFTIVGLQEFFYDQVPAELRCVGMAIYLSVLGIGSFLSSILISLIDNLTSRGGNETSWLSDNLNRAHLDYFYWLLAGLSSIGLALFMFSAKSYIYTTGKVLL